MTQKKLDLAAVVFGSIAFVACLFWFQSTKAQKSNRHPVMILPSLMHVSDAFDNLQVLQSNDITTFYPDNIETQTDTRCDTEHMLDASFYLLKNSLSFWTNRTCSKSVFVRPFGSESFELVEEVEEKYSSACEMKGALIDVERSMVSEDGKSLKVLCKHGASCATYSNRKNEPIRQPAKYCEVFAQERDGLAQLQTALGQFEKETRMRASWLEIEKQMERVDLRGFNERVE